ncbi:MAG: MATE family efflux transporter [Pseudomonadota bacterium]
MSKSRDLTEGSVSGHLVRLGLPTIIAVAGILSVSMADAYFLGQLGTDELAAISFTFPVLMVVASLGIGMAAGAASVVSRAIGRGGQANINRLATDSLLIAFIVSTVVAIVGWLTVRPFFAMLGADGAVLDLVTGYMRLWYLGAPLLAVPMVAAGLIRANGDAVAPSVAMLIGSLLNVALDAILIFGWGPIPELGILGAGWAQIFARIFSASVTVAIVVFRERLITWCLPTAVEFTRSLGSIARVGVPATFSNMINPISVSVVTAILATTYGKEAVAAFGVATRVEAFTTIPMLALSSAIGPVAGQNWGRDRRDRTRRAMRDTFWFVILCGLILGGSFFMFGDVFVAFFTSDSVVENLAVSYLTFVGITLGGYGVVITASAALNAIDKAIVGLLITVLRSFVLYVPLAVAAVMIGPPWLVFAGIALANVLSGAVSGVLAFRMAQDVRKPAAEGLAAEVG